MSRATSIAVREAVQADARAIGSLRHEDEPHRERLELQAWALHLLRTTRPQDGWIAVAEVDGEVIGWGRAGVFAPPPHAPDHCCPAGWYLLGVNVAGAWRRQGVGSALVRARTAWIAQRSPRALCFVAPDNVASLELHARCGFAVTRQGVWFPLVAQRELLLMEAPLP